MLRTAAWSAVTPRRVAPPESWPQRCSECPPLGVRVLIWDKKMVDLSGASDLLLLARIAMSDVKREVLTGLKQFTLKHCCWQPI